MPTLEANRALVAASVYANGKRVADVAIEEAGAWSKRPGHVVWIGLFEPSHDLLARVQAQFDLHPLAIEDAGKPHQHPEAEQYGEALFIVARTAQIVDERIAFGETHIFVGRGYVVTVRHGASTSYATVRERCESCPTVLSHGEHYILYAILDFIVDNYMPVVETIHDEVEAIEDRVFGTPFPTRPTVSASTCCAATCCGCATRPHRWSMSAAGSNMRKSWRSTRRCSPCSAT